MLDGLAQKLVVLFILAGIAEILVEAVKDWLGKFKFLTKQIKTYIALAVSIAVGVIYAVQTGTSILILLGFTVKWPVVDIIMTGLFVAAGSKVIYKIYELLTGWKDVMDSKKGSGAK